MVADSGVINVNDASGDGPPAAEPEAPAATPAPEAGAPAAEQPAARPRSWSMPASPVSRTQVDAFGRAAATSVGAGAAAIGKAIACVARVLARIAAQLWRAVDAVPAAPQLLAAVTVLMLLGVVGSIAATGTLGVICSVVVVPVCSVALGALGHRWFTRTSGAPAADESDLTRSVRYVDKKLTLALNSLGSERHQQAVIALFQAKTAVELTLGTETYEGAVGEAPVHVDAYRLRPRIQAGSASKSAVADSTSLAAS